MVYGILTYLLFSSVFKINIFYYFNLIFPKISVFMQLKANKTD